MSEFDREQEQEIFVAETASLDVFAKVGEQAYARFRLFEYDSLMLLRSHFTSEFMKWLPIIELASTNQAASEQLMWARDEILKFREQYLGLKAFGPDRESAEDALTILFLLCLESWPQRPEAVAKTTIVQGVDEFATTFIEFYGRSKSLLEALKQRFEIKSR
ncbi:hypothetical protein SAMN02745857_00512 [Andreprevotia lacus DSM 23236]|jgi:hypothetical protein|uniref:Uncharacterized protein n=1 Tax=Andreprevotia lacus DSM 23236 TaxID=1121001 RepID=A0A1W1X2Y2_9NEIS|nr:hypothetical protein [Andreprevotia lacus]SMC18264.1 hypothetical protein SAMN02745857_00512 [Andreprevotia lacus DSM 23236]